MALTSICWLLPKTEENQYVVHTTGEHPYFRTPVGQEWVLACGRRTKPEVCSPVITAVTCKGCLEVHKAQQAKESSSSETMGVQGVDSAQGASTSEEHTNDSFAEKLANFTETENDEYIEYSN